MKLTLKEEKFCQEAVRLGNLSAAYRASYDTRTNREETVYVAACTLGAKPKIARRIKEIQDQAAAAAGVTEQYVLSGLVTLAETAKEGGTRARAFELLGKALSMFTEKHTIETLESEDTLRQRLKELQKMAKDEGIELETVH